MAGGPARARGTSVNWGSLVGVAGSVVGGVIGAVAGGGVGAVPGAMAGAAAASAISKAAGLDDREIGGSSPAAAVPVAVSSQPDGWGESPLVLSSRPPGACVALWAGGKVVALRYMKSGRMVERKLG